MTHQNDHAQEEPTPVIGPGILAEIDQRLRGNTLVSDIDPMTIFPQNTPEDLEKLEARVEGWYNSLSKLGELKAILCDMKSMPFTGTNKVGNYYLRVEQYLMVLAHPNCTPELKARYWADVEAAQNSQAEVVPTISVTLTQSEYGENNFSAALGEVGKDPAYTVEGNWEQCIKRCTQFYRVRRWNCGGWRVLFPKGDPIQVDEALTLSQAIAARLDDQKNDLLLERSVE